MSDSKDDFEEQLRQEKILQDTAGDDDALGQARTRVDKDGTVFEWDAEKKAWFPKVVSSAKWAWLLCQFYKENMLSIAFCQDNF